MTIEQVSSKSCENLAFRFDVRDAAIRTHLHQLWKMCEVREMSRPKKRGTLNISFVMFSSSNLASVFDYIMMYDKNSSKEQTLHLLNSSKGITTTPTLRIHKQNILLCVW